MRVLVVEDEIRMAGLLGRALREEGHAVDVAADGPEGPAEASDDRWRNINGPERSTTDRSG
jgi:two-component system, OmpR family, response regulator